MERQTKHRILGILVLIGLVIILLPLFQSNQDLSTEAALVKAPPFPDQSVQVSTAATEPAPIKLDQQADADDTQPIANLPLSSDNSIKHPPADIMSAARPSIITNNQPTEHPKASLKANDSNQIELSYDDIIPPQTAANKMIEVDKAPSILKKAARINTPARNVKTPAIAAIKTPIKTTMNTPVKSAIDDDGLIKLKSAVWVIQIGSFKNKTNALRVVNQLRANGYRAFIQQISTALGDNTRVFVGPEHMRTTARALADRLQSEMHIQGIVISYKPLTL